MKIFTHILPMQKELQRLFLMEKSVGLVPTMGALHDGHAELLKISLSENDITVCSIFVNPTQFDNAIDLEKYPRNFEKDIIFLEVMDCDILFIPEVKEMYPEKTVIEVGFGALELPMEGAFRAGHFSGVGLVVSKLFNIIKPTIAYFGQKDLQQFTIVKQLVKDLNFNLKLVSVPIVREENGLAKSSRNQRLTPQEQEIAINLYKALNLAQDLLLNGGGVVDVKQEVVDYLAKWEEISLEYFEIVNQNDLKSVNTIGDKQKIALCIAAYVGKVRLIDNLFLAN